MDADELKQLAYPRHVHSAWAKWSEPGVSLVVHSPSECAAALATGLWFLTPILLGQAPVAPPDQAPLQSAEPPNVEPPRRPRGRPPKVKP